jgi:hypothetical protein
MQQEMIIKQVLDTWYSHVMRTNNLLDTLTDDVLQNEIAPGRNRGVYLLGHLTAVHDRMLPLLGFGERHHPELDAIFITNPDKAVQDMPATRELRAYWNEVNASLEKHFKALRPEEWMQRHTSVSEEDFVKEPHRNRLNVLLSRTNHLAEHLGQMILLKK